MPANLDALIREGVSAFKAGRKDEAHAVFIKATELDPYREEAWLWLSATVESVEDQRTCLENVLSINPGNERAKQGLALLAPANTNAPHVSAFSAPVPGPNAPQEPAAWSGIATSSASAAWDPSSELSDEDYDNWVSNLNLPAGGDSNPSAPPFPAPLTAPADDLLASSSPFGADEDEFFGGGPFSAADFGMDDAEDDERANEMLAALRMPSANPSPAMLPPAPAPVMPPAEVSAKYHPPSLARPVMSPVPEEPPEPPKRRDEDFERLFGSSDDFSLLEDIDRDQDGIALEEGEGELFGFIPKEIRPTRLPGTRERVPFLLIAGVFALVLLNLGAAVLLAYRILPL